VETGGSLSTDWSWWSGPKELWRRKLGVGYSAIVADDGVLYTMYRKTPSAEDEIVIALSAETGETLWEVANPAPIVGSPDRRWGGGGPNATPLIVEDRLYTLGSRAALRCLDKTTGKLLWSRDLVSEYGALRASKTGEGHSASPIAYKSFVIVAVGSRKVDPPAGGKSVIAFDQMTGREVWSSLDFGFQHASPILVRIGDQDMLVLDAPPDVVGVDPNTGITLWSHTLSAEHATPSPVFDGKNAIFFVGVGDTPVATLIRLRIEKKKIVPEVVWEDRRLRINVGTPVLVDGHLYGSTDHVLFGMDIKTGKRLWIERGFPRASCVYADGKLITLDENGTLSVATASPQGLTIHDQHTIAARYSLTVPTLVGTSLYVRDRGEIMALDLGK